MNVCAVSAILTGICAVTLIAACGWLAAVCGFAALPGIWLPYAAVLICTLGLGARLLLWACTPVPFAIPLTGGQIGTSPLDAPTSRLGVAGRLALEAVCFRSLLRTTRAVDCGPAPRLALVASRWLWLLGLLLHYSLLVVLLRHTRLWLEPVPDWVTLLSRFDSWLDVGTPVLYLSGVLLPVVIGCLLLRRTLLPQLRALSLPADFFVLFLLLALALSGLLMRHSARIDLTQAKLHLLHLVRFTPGLSEASRLEPILLVHMTLASALLICLPFSKLVHAGALFFSPSRNLRCDTRAVHHENPWQQPAQGGVFRSYAEYEAAFAPQLQAAGLPLDHNDPQAGC